jgi:hypothetical protein
MDFHKSETMENSIDRLGEMKDETGTSHLLCVPDLVPRKKIPKHRTLALSYMKTHCRKGFTKDILKLRKI